MSGKGGLPDRIVATLRGLGLDGFGALFIEALAPLGVLGAQVLYLAQPLFSIPSESIDEWVNLLEDPQELSALSRKLEGGPTER